MKELADCEYHIARWIDPNGGFCDRSVMVKHPMSVVYRGALLMARSKRLGCKEEDMFDGKTINGKNVTVTAKNIYYPETCVISANLVTFECDGESFTYRMCDYSSACSFSSEDGKYFNINV